MCADNLLRDVTERKVIIDVLADDLRNQIASKAQQIRDTNTDNPKLPGWRTEMRDLQDRLVKKPEAETHRLCDELVRKAGLTEVFKRNTDATNQNLKGEAWAKFV